MRVNTRTGRIELTKQEQAALKKAGEICRLIAKHGEDDAETFAEDAVSALEGLKQAMAEQGKEPVTA